MAYDCYDDARLEVNCVLFTKNQKCAHPDYRGLFSGPKPCVYADQRVTGCRIQVEYPKPASPPRKP